MNKHALYHKSESEYCFPISLNKALIRFRTARNDDDIKQINIIYNMSAYFPKSQLKMKMELIRNDELFSYYEAILDLEIPSYFYYFEIIDKKDKSHYYLENGISDFYDHDFHGMLVFRVPWINESNTMLENKKFQGDVVYQIFPERFLKGIKNKDTSYINREWNSTDLKGSKTERNISLGGDLQGIYDKLDYIRDLGIDVIYMTPITLSGSNHKYNVKDYYQIDPYFGDEKLFKKLVKAAHEKGMKIIMDLVFNHTSKDHPFFQDVLKYGKASKYYDFYFMQDKPLKTDGLNYYSFNSCAYMPKLNSNNPKVQDYFAGVAEYYLKEFNVDGFRLDVANEVSHDFWINFNHRVRSVKPDCFIVGENWDNAHNYLCNNQFNGTMNYTFFATCWQYFVKQEINTEKFVDQLNWLLTRYPNEANKMCFNLLDSHDTPRMYNYMNGNKDKYLLAFLVLISYLGMPMIYYGDEIFMMGAGDPDNRRGMDWDSKEFNSYHHKLFKDILHLRDLDVFRNGDIKIQQNGGVIKIMRVNKYINVSIYLNNNNDDKIIDIKGDIVLSNKLEGKTLKPYGFAVIKN